MRKTFSDSTQALTTPTRGPVDPVVGIQTRNIMQGEAKRATPAPTGNPWTYQWCKPCHATNVLLCPWERSNPNPWTSGSRGRSPNSQYNAGRSHESHTLAHGLPVDLPVVQGVPCEKRFAPRLGAEQPQAVDQWIPWSEPTLAI